jgi:hypothetical protein
MDLDLKVDENLPNYFKALEKDDKLWLRLEEEHSRQKYVRIRLPSNIFFI